MMVSWMRRSMGTSTVVDMAMVIAARAMAMTAVMKAAVIQHMEMVNRMVKHMVMAMAMTRHVTLRAAMTLRTRRGGKSSTFMITGSHLLDSKAIVRCTRTSWTASSAG